MLIWKLTRRIFLWHCSTELWSRNLGRTPNSLHSSHFSPLFLLIICKIRSSATCIFGLRNMWCVVIGCVYMHSHTHKFTFKSFLDSIRIIHTQTLSVVIIWGETSLDLWCECKWCFCTYKWLELPEIHFHMFTLYYYFNKDLSCGCLYASTV